MPYLTLGDYDPQNAARQSLSRRGVIKDNDFMGRRDSKYISHSPLTLDQYYYPGISDTSYRDDNQVLSKYLEKHQEKPVIAASRTHPRSGAGKKQILMVDQLWIWIIDDRMSSRSTGVMIANHL
jgi:hypothetical protein